MMSPINVVDQTIGSLHPLLPALLNPKSNKAKPVVESSILPISNLAFSVSVTFTRSFQAKKIMRIEMGIMPINNQRQEV